MASFHWTVLAQKGGEPPCGLECIRQECNETSLAIFVSHEGEPLADVLDAEHEDVVLVKTQRGRKVAVLIARKLKSQYNNPDWGIDIEYDADAVVGDDLKIAHIQAVLCYTPELQAQLTSDGAPGADGAGLQVDGVVADEASLPAADASNNGQNYNTLDQNRVFRSDGSTWTLIGYFGAAGPAGPNNITTSTDTDITGILKGDGSNVAAAVADTDYTTPTALASGLSGKSDNGHTHDDRYYTETEIDAMIPGSLADLDAAANTKLSNIEVNATADQTGAEIKALYEGEADTNAFTDSEKSKLGGIESNATGDQTGAEIKTAYEGEANTNAFTDSEKTKLASIEPNATGDQTGAEIKAAYEGESNTNAFTDAEKTKLASLESSRFKGAYANLTALQTAHPTASPGDYADVDAGVAADVERYVWDDSDSDWVLSGGSGGGETAASIKTKYESNADTNAFTDAEKSKLGAIEVNATADQTGAEIKTAYEAEADTNAFNDASKTKVDHLSVSAATNLDQIRSDVATNNGKVTNATHTGDVTGSTSLTIAANAVTKAKIENATAQGKILARVSPGAGLFEEAEITELLNLISGTASGDILYRDGSTWVRLPKGTDGQILQLDSGFPSWQDKSNFVITTDGTEKSTTSPIPFDDTIPQNTEGEAYSELDTSITPKSDSSDLLIDLNITLSASDTHSGVVALFRDNDVDAIAAIPFTCSNSNHFETVSLRCTVPSNSTSETTFKVRFGRNDISVKTVYCNQSSLSLFGSKFISSLSVCELR